MEREPTSELTLLLLIFGISLVANVILILTS